MSSAARLCIVCFGRRGRSCRDLIDAYTAISRSAVVHGGVAPENIGTPATNKTAFPMPNLFDIDCELEYDVAQQTVFVFNLAVPDDARQRVIAESMTVTPAAQQDDFRDPAGINRFVRIDAPPGPMSIRYRASIEIDPPPVHPDAPQIPVATLPGPLLTYLRASRYCEADRLFPLALAEFGHLPADYARVQSICRWIRENIEYRIGTSTPTTTAQDVLDNRAGVCRDFAHLAIAFCRALNIPARFVTAYAVYREPPPDFHAVFEAYLGDRWYLFDPTELSQLHQMVRIGAGIDASAVPFATFFGAARLRRLAPLIEPTRIKPRSEDELASLQAPDAGILLAA
jgi:transglutaminase-like putative cysteine protease